MVAYRARVSPNRMWRDMFDPRSLLPPSKAENERVDGLLELLRLTRVAKAPVAALPLGILRLVEVGRALASDPQVLLLDEPLSGLDIKASENLLGVFRQIVDQADPPLSLILVEHDVAAVLSLSDRCSCSTSANGSPAGTPEQIRQDPAVRAAYLGDSDPPQRTSAPVVATAPGDRWCGVSEPLLEVRDLDVSYGSSQALFSVSVSVQPGTVLAVLGANGAGKSTLARAVSGLVRPSGGQVFFEGRPVTGLPAYKMRKLGLTYIPEGRGIFPGLSVIDNLRMAVAQERRGERASAIDRAIERFPVLGQPAQPAGRQPVRGRAADAGPGPSPGRLAQAGDRRRDVARPGTPGGRVGLRGPRGGAALGHHHRADRAVRAPGPLHGGQLHHPDQGECGLERSGRGGGPGGDRPLPRGGREPRSDSHRRFDFVTITILTRYGILILRNE